MNWFPEFNYILASASPRRQQLLSLLGIPFRVETRDVDETYPANLGKLQIPEYLARLKAEPFKDSLTGRDLLITADTIVWHDEKVLGKPACQNDAVRMLLQLSGKEHEVISGVCLTSGNKQISFHALSVVSFRVLTMDEIEYYVSEYKPFDKAGAYGIQEWIGVVGISHIEGSFYNVMGLPVQKLYDEIQKF